MSQSDAAAAASTGTGTSTDAVRAGNGNRNGAGAADPEVVASAVLACPHVVGLRSAPTSGVGADVATYLPGRRVDGVRVTRSAVAVRVVGWFGRNLPEFADEVRAAVTAVAPSVTTVDVFIDDLLVMPDDTAEPYPSADDGQILAMAGRRSPAFTRHDGR